jgi:hypothetical protein
MPEHPIREYIALVTKHWLRWIAGPVAAVFGLVIVPIVGLRGSFSTQTTTWLSIASVVIAILLLWPAQYTAWKQERSLRQEAESTYKKPDIKGEAYGFVFDDKRINTELIDHLTNKSRVAYQFKLDLHNHRDIATNLVTIELDGSKLPEPVKFSHIEYPHGIVLEYAKAITLDVHCMADATFEPETLKLIDLDMLKVYVIDGLHERHEIPTKPGEKLAHYF